MCFFSFLVEISPPGYLGRAFKTLFTGNLFIQETCQSALASLLILFSRFFSTGLSSLSVYLSSQDWLNINSQIFFQQRIFSSLLLLVLKHLTKNMFLDNLINFKNLVLVIHFVNLINVCSNFGLKLIMLFVARQNGGYTFLINTLLSQNFSGIDLISLLLLRFKHYSRVDYSKKNLQQK